MSPHLREIGSWASDPKISGQNSTVTTNTTTMSSLTSGSTASRGSSLPLEAFKNAPGGSQPWSSVNRRP
ncbi:hypothetical protein NUU61_000526 [Penicillium alfredii]|uniref:Uncharacterized protein n=1 Tax=Penicillium alfredii TaxID=1506179 RepID=A0A9W9KQZ4_9EURO|nr:uncharacterized protein NUU61_000526 [Penicillium alfredii]KAJ5114767.1 hypothetical protein NUU61_000526 [Penicillium alfredii]